MSKALKNVTKLNTIVYAEDKGIMPANTASANIAAINTLIIELAAAGGGVINFPAGEFQINASIAAKSYVSIVGVYGETNQSGVGPGGTRFKWTGGNTGTMLNVVNVREATFSGFCLDGQSGTAVVGINYDSTDGSTAENEFTKFTIRECFTGVQWGNSGILVGNAAQGRFEDFTIWSAVPGSWGFIVNSGNVGQQCVMGPGGIQCGTAAGGGAIDLKVCNLLQIRRVFGGGTHAPYFIRVAYAKDVLIEGCSSEMWGPGSAVAWRHNDAYFLYQVKPSNVGVDASADDATDKYTITLIQNQINNPIKCDWKNRIVAIGNGWGDCKDSVTEAIVGAAGYFTSAIGAGVTSKVTAINEGFDTDALNPATNEPIKGWRDGANVSLSNLDPGRGWVAPPFSAADFTGSGGMVVTVDPSDVETYAYTLDNRCMTVAFKINGMTLATTAGYVISLKIPLGKRSTKGMLGLVRITSGSNSIGMAYVSPGGATIDVQPVDSSLWTLGVNNVAIQGQITFEVN